ncbi:acetyl esterase [Bacillus niacini]|uniref:Acetyl esterase n=1 Tax=Neobacillus niacini TaxID=86668 RepID=A0A852T8Z6_9BACI|nr:alpha/beta hydrolase [Neobacillus niacini]NYE04267.1 acetyl esterase [Neobacillus niacini]
MAKLVPEAQAYVTAFNQLPDFSTMDPEDVRAIMAQAKKIDMEIDQVAKVEDREIFVGSEGKITVRIYIPEGEGPFPIFIYYHGGGWVLGNLDGVDPSCRVLANKTKCVVISVDYRLAPEFKFPIPAEDSYAALTWVNENAVLFNGIASKIIVGGDSAGGNLATVVSMMSRDRKGPDISAQVLLYPVTDLSYDTESYYEFAEGYALNRNLMKWFGTHYIRNEEDRINPYVAPLISGNLHDLPQAFIITAENDVLRDEGIAYAERLMEAEVKVIYKVESGLVHGYFSNYSFFKKSIEKTVGSIKQFLSSLD